MKKIALITASLAMLASPAFAQEAKDRRHCAGGSKILDGVEGRNVLFEAEGPERL